MKFGTKRETNRRFDEIIIDGENAQFDYIVDTTYADTLAAVDHRAKLLTRVRATAGVLVCGSTVAFVGGAEWMSNSQPGLKTAVCVGSLVGALTGIGVLGVSGYMNENPPEGLGQQFGPDES